MIIYSALLAGFQEAVGHAVSQMDSASQECLPLEYAAQPVVFIRSEF